MKYISLFSGIGGLEAAGHDPVLCCEIDPACRAVLTTRFPDTVFHDDIVSLSPPKSDLVAGGWPCQDISIAGLGKGLEGKRSSLFFAMLSVAVKSSSESIVAENVPNLLRLNRGRVFQEVLDEFAECGYPNVAWRTLNAREFGLPHQRDRIFIVASKHVRIAKALHRQIPYFQTDPVDDHKSPCAAFYTTAGTQSICYSKGYTPTLKVGSSISIPSPPGVHFGDVVRKMTPEECLRLQGFDPAAFRGVKPADVYRMAGNAVAVPVGQFAMASAIEEGETEIFTTQLFSSKFEAHGLFVAGEITSVVHQPMERARNLSDFIDYNNQEPLSARASAGLVRRLRRSGSPCPSDLYELLCKNGGIEPIPLPEKQKSASGRGQIPSSTQPGLFY